MIWETQQRLEINRLLYEVSNLFHRLEVNKIELTEEEEKFWIELTEFLETPPKISS